MGWYKKVVVIRQRKKATFRKRAKPTSTDGGRGRGQNLILCDKIRFFVLQIRMKVEKSVKKA